MVQGKPGEACCSPFSPQFPAIKSIFPSPSKSPALIAVQRPVTCDRFVKPANAPEPCTGLSHKTNLPRLFRKIRRGPNSPARTSSGKPSEFKSVNTEELTHCDELIAREFSSSF